ncbi:hypothetical protein OAE63_00830 [bacterium]|nr:hypothetical protein [bacterium]
MEYLLNDRVFTVISRISADKLYLFPVLSGGDMMAKKKESQPMRRVASIVLAIMIGWVLCESLLRVLVPWPIFYSTWFTEGVHQHDPQFGFVFRPDYEGAMRNVDQVWMEPVRLDSRGFRQSAVRGDRYPSSNQDAAKQPVKIVMLGGASMGFAYGLADDETLHHQIAERLPEACQIDLISWPGFTLGQDVQKLNQMLEPSQYDVGVILAYGQDDYDYQSDWDTLVPPANLHMIDSVVTSNDPAAWLGGEIYWDSYVVAGMCRLLRIPASWLGGRVNDLDALTEMASNKNPEDGKPQILMASERLRSLGVDSVLIIALPRQSGILGPAVLPDAVGSSLLDLRREPEHQQFDWIAYGHYGPESVKHLAEKIANALESLE